MCVYYYDRVCLPDSQKSWIAKSFMIKEEIHLRYFNRKTLEINNEQQNEKDFVFLKTTSIKKKKKKKKF
jgi:tubulin--tyrosine ligase